MRKFIRIDEYGVITSIISLAGEGALIPDGDDIVEITNQPSENLRPGRFRLRNGKIQIRPKKEIEKLEKDSLSIVAEDQLITE